MFEDFQICPYTGLRSFTEEESLYFKGREEDIDQATSQLQRNKFLMLTGASGDGKSSLIYAGIIPNARAGFLKSKYTQWCVADFRPERTPFDNLCNTISRQLDISDIGTVKSELNHGFSALVDLYRSSKRYVDTDSVEWIQADEEKRAAMKRDAANLIVLVDQFEEFFTNPENYRHGVPSKESNLVLNLLLETARISLDEDLPIYVVFTMRSDYIGQCAAFRGLPEYLGFSQFFVPRLNRAQLQLVIEEPAVLSGNRITRRLTERLIHDITEGVDQLPILQHALNQIWVAASQGKEDMDLIHYAMVGGMSADELPDEEIERFRTWFNELPPTIKKCYSSPSLQNVLDTHCNKLYEQAAGYYLKQTGKSISDDQAKAIIRKAFTCLTKIDQSRAVRNRMTLKEITDINNQPGISTNDVGSLLNIFREPGNTFIHPFITEDGDSNRQLNSGQVLDITHESLIRNWEYLGQWAREENESREISIDFEQQLGRWVDSRKSGNFLLSIGPLTYFENWYNKVKPNVYWIARYLPQDNNNKQAILSKANEVLDNANEFLQRSARKHVITRTVMRYGPKRIAAVLGILAFLALTSFMVRDYFNKKNSAVLKSIRKETIELANDAKMTYIDKINLLTDELMLGHTTVDELVSNVDDPLTKISVSSGIGSYILIRAKGEPKEILSRSLAITDSLLEKYTLPLDDPFRLSKSLEELNKFRVVLGLTKRYAPDLYSARLRDNQAHRSANWTLEIFKKQPQGFTDILGLNEVMEHALNYKSFTKEELNQLLGLLSPFEGGLQSEWLRKSYNRDNVMYTGGLSYGIKFNGLYQELAYLYAASGNSEKALQCVDTLLVNSQINFENDYANGADNASNIAVVFHHNGNLAAMDSFVAGYCLRKKTSQEDFYIRLLQRTLFAYASVFTSRMAPFMDWSQNINLQDLNAEELDWFYEKYRKVVSETVSNVNQKNYLIALSYKNEGIQMSILKDPDGKNYLNADRFYDQAIAAYHAIDEDFLDQKIVVPSPGGIDQANMPRKFLFVYPDIRTSIHPVEPRNYFYYYTSDDFMDYLIRKNLLDSFFNNTLAQSYLSLWLGDMNKRTTFLVIVGRPVRMSVLAGLEENLKKINLSNSVDLNPLYLRLGNAAQDSGNRDKMVAYYDQIQNDKLFNHLTTADFGGNLKNGFFTLIGTAVKGFARTGHFDKAAKLVSQFKSPVNRSSLYAFAAERLFEERKSPEIARQLIDSSKMELSRVETLTGGQPNRRILAYAIAMEAPSRNVSDANAMIKNLPLKFSSLSEINGSFAFYGDLYEAKSRMPSFISNSDKAYFLTKILNAYARGITGWPEEWNNYINNEPQRKFELVYEDENS